MAIIEVENLTKVYSVYQKREGFRAAVRGLFRREYRPVRAVDGISFQIEEGEMVGFLGPNGAGKTTTLKMLSGLIYPTSGAATVMGFVPWERANAFRRQFALVMGQRNQLWWDLPAQESFRLHREMYGIPPDQFERVLGEMTELLTVSNLVSQPVRELSLGERMKMELIAALLHSPRVVLLDEPTIGLDVVAQANIQQCLQELNERKRTTVLLTSHYMKDVEALCRRIIVINQGKIIYDGLLSGVVARFGNHKIIKLQMAAGQPMPSAAELDGLAQLVDTKPPIASLRVDRTRVPQVLGSLLNRFELADVSVEDPPLEEVIGEVFKQS
ncbi:MAG: ABC transporter ATP-binding protein [Planctomycetes bacterium]|nr:ABC transporter ATP-binding protein [Planctomycetota bacterium]